MPGTFHPRRFPLHQTIKGALVAGAALANATEAAEGINLAGAARCRIRFKATVGGTLRLWARRPDPNSTTRYATVLGSTAVTANTEATLDIAELYGEQAGDIAFTPSGLGTVTYCDFAAL